MMGGPAFLRSSVTVRVISTRSEAAPLFARALLPSMILRGKVRKLPSIIFGADFQYNSETFEPRHFSLFVDVRKKFQIF
jgi:hypothetical protein